MSARLLSKGGDVLTFVVIELALNSDEALAKKLWEIFFFFAPLQMLLVHIWFTTFI